MERPVKALRHLLNGYSESETARRLNVSSPTIARDMEHLARDFPGLLTAIAIVKQVNKREARGLMGTFDAKIDHAKV